MVFSNQKVGLALKLQQIVADAVCSSTGADLSLDLVEIETPVHDSHGDYSSNVAMVLAKQLGRNPRELATLIAGAIETQNLVEIEKVEVVGAFVNFFVSKKYLLSILDGYCTSRWGGLGVLAEKKIMVEYAHPNTHKEMHIGHMRTLITGEAVARILVACGARVFRANYQGDIGPHVAKSIWGTQQILAERQLPLEEADRLSAKEKAHLLGDGYVRGNKFYEENREEIDGINKSLYANEPRYREVYEMTRRWSLEYYDAFYERFDTVFDRLYFESEVAREGKKIVEENIGKVFEKSDGAVIFDGEKFGLHKRVFITKDGNPTYEGKDIGLAFRQWADFEFDRCIHVVANEQNGYFEVVISALGQIDPKLGEREFHLSMGMVNLVGRKISSRTGDIVTVDGLLDEVKARVVELASERKMDETEKEEALEAVTMAAVKYSVLKSSPLVNVAFDLNRSVDMQGESGPYLLYTMARVKSVLRKAPDSRFEVEEDLVGEPEIKVMRKLAQFDDVVAASGLRLAPHLLSGFLYDLAAVFNEYYNKHQIISEDIKKTQARVLITQGVALVLEQGLGLLGIKSVEKM